MATMLRPRARRRASRSPITSPSNSPILARFGILLPLKSPVPTIPLGPNSSDP